MLGLSEQTRVFLRPGVTDGRLAFEGLRALAVNVIRQDVLAGTCSCSATGATTASAACTGTAAVFGWRPSASSAPRSTGRGPSRR
jgi:hypothetical protein